jgi:hypothetical protein
MENLIWQQYYVIEQPQLSNGRLICICSWNFILCWYLETKNSHSNSASHWSLSCHSSAMKWVLCKSVLWVTLCAVTCYDFSDIIVKFRLCESQAYKRLHCPSVSKFYMRSAVTECL